MASLSPEFDSVTEKKCAVDSGGESAKINRAGYTTKVRCPDKVTSGRIPTWLEVLMVER